MCFHFNKQYSNNVAESWCSRLANIKKAALFEYLTLLKLHLPLAESKKYHCLSKETLCTTAKERWKRRERSEEVLLGCLPGWRKSAGVRVSRVFVWCAVLIILSLCTPRTPPLRGSVLVTLTLRSKLLVRRNGRNLLALH